MNHFNFYLAQETDDVSLRKILKETPMDGRIKLTFKREPNFFYATRVEGELSQVIIARESIKQEIGVLGCRSVKSVYMNGKEAKVGYLSGLRIHPHYRNSTLLARGYQYLHACHQDHKVPFYLTTISQDNQHAIDLLTQQRATLPAYIDLGMYCTSVIDLSRGRKQHTGTMKVVKGDLCYLDPIVECLNRNGREKQFYPVYTRDLFLSRNGRLRDFNIEDFYVAIDGDKVVGVMAKWDQSSFKQIMVNGYKGFFSRMLPLYHLSAGLLGLPRLPNPGSQINYFYVSFMAIDSNEPEIFRSLLQAMYNVSINTQYDYFMIGLHETDPLLKIVRADYRFVKFDCRLYIACWDDGRDSYQQIDGRIPYLELATL